MGANRLPEQRDDHTIVADPDRAPLIVRAFELAATGQYSLTKLSEKLYREGLRSIRAGQRLRKQAMARVLKNPIYYGWFVWSGKTYRGKFEPLVTNLFDRAQEAMGFAQKPKLTKHDFSFSGVLTCGHCGCSITAERKEAIQLSVEVVDWTRKALLDSSRTEREFREDRIKRLTRRYRQLDQHLSRA